jgi:hypothetical protein
MNCLHTVEQLSHLAVVEWGPGNGGLEPVLAAGRLAVRNLPEAVDISTLPPHKNGISSIEFKPIFFLGLICFMFLFFKKCCIDFLNLSLLCLTVGYY